MTEFWFLGFIMLELGGILWVLGTIAALLRNGAARRAQYDGWCDRYLTIDERGPLRCKRRYGHHDELGCEF